MIRLGKAFAIVVFVAAIALYYVLEVKLGGKTALWLFHALVNDEEGRWHVYGPSSMAEFAAESDAIVIATVVGSEPAGVLVYDCAGHVKRLASDEALDVGCAGRVPVARDPVNRITLRVDEVLKDDGRLVAGDTIGMAEHPGPDLMSQLPCRATRILTTQPGRRYLFALDVTADPLRLAVGLPSLDYRLAWSGDYDGRLDISGPLVRTTGCNPRLVDLTYRLTPGLFRRELQRAIDG